MKYVAPLELVSTNDTFSIKILPRWGNCNDQYIPSMIAVNLCINRSPAGQKLPVQPIVVFLPQLSFFPPFLLLWLPDSRSKSGILTVRPRTAIVLSGIMHSFHWANVPFRIRHCCLLSQNVSVIQLRIGNVLLLFSPQTLASLGMRQL